MNRTGKPEIFLCHAKEDATEVRKVYELLRNLNIGTWFDEEDLLPGQKWRLVIPQVMDKSDFILIFFSSKVISKRGYVQKELKMALELLEEFPENEILLFLLD